MAKENLKVVLAPIDMRILRECAHFQTLYWRNALKACQSGDASPLDFNDTFEEADLEYFIERHDYLLEQLNETLKPAHTNELEYLDEFQMFRNSQRVECVRLLGRQTTKVVFVFHTRHGSHFVYEQMEALVQHFIDDSEPEHRFESEAELEWFLKFWDVAE